MRLKTEMNEIINAQANADIKNIICPDLYRRFIQYVDRSDRTQQTYITNLRQFACWLNYEGIEMPSREDIYNYRNWLASEHEAIVLGPDGRWKYQTDKNGNILVRKLKPATIRIYLQSVKQFFHWTQAEGFYPNIADNIHAPKVKQDFHKKEALTLLEVKTIEQSILDKSLGKALDSSLADKDKTGREQRAIEQGKRLYAMYLLSVTCGLRCIELSRANVRDLEARQGKAYLYIYGKGHSEADTRKTLPAGVYKALQEYLKSRADTYTGNSPLFVATGNRSKGKRLASTTISKMIKQALIDSGYNSEKLTAHSLRHTAGTTAMQLSNNLYEVQHYMRHANPSTTEIYLHAEDDRKDEELANQIYDYFHSSNF